MVRNIYRPEEDCDKDPTFINLCPSAWTPLCENKKWYVERLYIEANIIPNIPKGWEPFAVTEKYIWIRRGDV